MTLATRLARLNAAVLSRVVGYGEPVRLYARAGVVEQVLPEGLTDGQIITLTGAPFDSCVLVDQEEAAIPAASWSCNLATGVLTMADPLDLGEAVVPLIALTLSYADVVGVVDLYAEEANRRPRSVGGNPLGTPQQPRPIVWLTVADAAGVQERDEIGIRDAVYFAVAKDTDDGGLVRVELMRKPADAAATQHDRWQ